VRAQELSPDSKTETKQSKLQAGADAMKKAKPKIKFGRRAASLHLGDFALRLSRMDPA
jgi:hypothetical protein